MENFIKNIGDTFNQIKHVKNEVKRAKDELTGNVTPVDYSQAEIKAYENRKAQVNEKPLTREEQNILASTPSRDKLAEMIKADRERKSEGSSDYNVAA